VAFRSESKTARKGIKAIEKLAELSELNEDGEEEVETIDDEMYGEYEIIKKRRKKWKLQEQCFVLLS
jgi:hypothetical protein